MKNAWQSWAQFYVKFNDNRAEHLRVKGHTFMWCIGKGVYGLRGGPSCACVRVQDLGEASVVQWTLQRSCSWWIKAERISTSTHSYSRHLLAPKFVHRATLTLFARRRRWEFYMKVLKLVELMSLAKNISITSCVMFFGWQGGAACTESSQEMSGSVWQSHYFAMFTSSKGLYMAL